MPVATGLSLRPITMMIGPVTIGGKKFFDRNELFKVLEEIKPDIVVNDIYPTSFLSLYRYLK